MPTFRVSHVGTRRPDLLRQLGVELRDDVHIEGVIEYDDGEVRQEFSLCFRAQPVSGELRTSRESKEVLWVEPAKLDGLNIHPAIRLRIAHGFEGF